MDFRTIAKQTYEFSAPAGIAFGTGILIKANPFYAAAFTATVIVIAKVATKAFESATNGLLRYPSWQQRLVVALSIAVPSAVAILAFAKSSQQAVYYIGIATVAKVAFNLADSTLQAIAPFKASKKAT
jgi:hypothetical protein